MHENGLLGLKVLLLGTVIAFPSTYNDIFSDKRMFTMMKNNRQNTTIQDSKTIKALERVVNQAMSNGEATEAYLCTLQLPRQFADNQHQANDIYKRIQSDFCKSVMRSTGKTPRYITVKTENATNPEYANRLIRLIETYHIARLDTLYQERLESGYFKNYPNVQPPVAEKEPAK